MNIKFYLKRADRPRTAVEAIIHFDGHRMKVGAGVSIEPTNWNADKGRAKRGYRHEAAVNGRLNTIEAEITATYMRLVNEGITPTPALLRDRLQSQPKQADDYPSVLDALTAFIEHSKTTLRPRSVMIYGTVKTLLKEFESAYGLRLEWQTINVLFFQKFVEFSVRVKQVSNETIDKNLQRLRAFLRHCDEVLGYPVCPDYRKFTKRNLPKGEASGGTFLTVDELAALQELDLRDNPRLERVRDVFVFQCLTGVRFGDLQKLRPDHRHGSELQITTEKNRKSVVIPLSPAARAIWDRYGGELPVPSAQKMNQYLKEVAALAKLDEPVTIIRYSGSKRIERVKPKHEVLSSHAAKRTYVSLLRQRGVSLEAVMKVTGNTRRTIETYVKRGDRDAIDEVAEALQ